MASDEAKKRKAEYVRKYRERNRERINARRREIAAEKRAAEPRRPTLKPKQPSQPKPTKLSKLKCEVCRESIPQHAVNHGERRFCRRECAIRGGGIPDVFGVLAEKGKAVPPEDKGQVRGLHPCGNPACSQLVKYPRRHCSSDCPGAAHAARAEAAA